ncbi:hypothetical protein GCM10023219_05880 [Stakelama sediminis]|uniref:Uncharacterized protein n=1 Tax=Stakelama sediminis TaxID=463200 RepID=A0A840YUV3_9SPHN|nr:hypothetical protein [Stakelama sediminis]MBB5717305.1 hypothetical protein [Stakelama sediminis]
MTTRFWTLVMCGAALAASPALAQDNTTTTQGQTEVHTTAASQDNPPKKVRSVILYGSDKCPKAQGDEIVVCSKADESPYRIPKRFRQLPNDVAHSAWGRKVEVLEDQAKIGLPDSCSPVGTGGQTGCTAQMLRQWRAEQRAKQQEESDIPN